MKKALLIFTVIILSCSMAFAGSEKTKTILKTVNNAIDVGGYVNTITQKAEILGDISSVKDVVVVGNTGASVVGASGSAIMGKMAATGAALGGGVVAGTAITAGSGGFGAASLMNRYVFDGDSKADKAARVGTYAGAAAGTAASVGALTVAGAGPVGLATIGAAVGGGMAAGAVAVVAAPVVAAGALGGAVYWLFSD